MASVNAIDQLVREQPASLRIDLEVPAEITSGSASALSPSLSTNGTSTGPAEDLLEISPSRISRNNISISLSKRASPSQSFILYDEDPRPSKILEETGPSVFRVRNLDDREVKRTFKQLVALPGGVSALAKFWKVSNDQVKSLQTGRMDRNQRNLRNRRGAGQHFSELPTDYQEDDDDEPKRKRQRRLRSSRTQRHSSSSSESESATRRAHRPQHMTQLRRSGRDKGQTRNLREVGEDELDEAEEIIPKAKVVGARESFSRLPHDNPFRLRHMHWCSTCNLSGDSNIKGPLVFCQSCTDAYHVSCLGPRGSREHLVTKISADLFVLQCRRCIDVAHHKDSLAPRLSRCRTCGNSGQASVPFRHRKTAREEQRERDDNHGTDPITSVAPTLINNAQNVLFRCYSCHLAFHLHHLPSLKERLLEIGDEVKRADDRFEQYKQTWMCNDCSDRPGDIGSLIAWRPTSQDVYALGVRVEDVPEEKKEYLIKWAQKSYYRSSWKNGPWVWAMAAAVTRNAFARKDDGVVIPKLRTEDAIPEEFLRVDIVLDVKYSNVVNTRVEEVEQARAKEVESALIKYKGLGYEHVVWEEPPDPSSTERWNDFQAAYNDWVRARYVSLPSWNAVRKQYRKAKDCDFETKIMLQDQPTSLVGGDLMGYQKEGVNWLLYQWSKSWNAILADEMGLGKTIQIIGFLLTLWENHRSAPFLIVVPNATCANWRREIKRWAPSLRVVTYFGSAKARDMALKHEMFPDGPGAGDLRCHVVITSYEAAEDVASQRVLRKINWAALIVDEGQRLKNDKNILYSALSEFKTLFKVLLTGTPLQNNQRELFNLLQFLDEDIKAEELEAKYADITEDNIAELHEQLKRFILRRTKAAVLESLPPMAQIIVPVSMTPLQRQLSENIYTKNTDVLRSIFADDKRSQPIRGLRNVLMQVRKCLCHPFVYSLAVEERNNEALALHRQLVEASSKLQLLEIMLPKLREQGHRVLIFSQFLDMLTMIEDFLSGLTLEYLRLDGTMGSLQKQKLIDQYNAPDSSIFAFLLSTRAGGVGINLATADTVIIMDPDFNPHQDLQAISRAHRIGQKNKVLVLQLMTRGSPEEKIMEAGKKKMMLDHVFIERMEMDEQSAPELESVLRYGAEALFNREPEEIRYDVASVEKLLDRSQIKASDKTATESQDAETAFSFARVWQNDRAELGEMEPDLNETAEGSDVWAKILGKREEMAMQNRAEAEAFGRGHRRRPKMGNGADRPQYADDLIEDPKDGGYMDAPGPIDSEDDSGNETDSLQLQEELKDLDAPDRFDGQSSLSIPHKKPTQDPSTTASRKPRQPTRTPMSARRFRRVEVLQPSTPSEHIIDHLSQISGLAASLRCLACDTIHARGSCPLKRAGVEYCNLCGLAHYGQGRACPHFSNEQQLLLMQKAIDASPEPQILKSMARRIVSTIKGSVVHQKKILAAARARRAQMQMENEQYRSFLASSQPPGHAPGSGAGNEPNSSYHRESQWPNVSQGRSTVPERTPSQLNITNVQPSLQTINRLPSLQQYSYNRGPPGRPDVAGSASSTANPAVSSAIHYFQTAAAAMTQMDVNNAISEASHVQAHGPTHDHSN